VADTATAQSKSDHTNWAIALTLLAYLLFSFVDTTTKWLIGVGLAALQLAFMRYAVHYAITLGETAIRQERRVMRPFKVKALMVLRSFSLVSSTVANFIALEHLPLAVTSTILFASPVIVCILARFVLREKLTFNRIFAVSLGLVGILIILDPFGQAINWYAVLMLWPATGMALYVVLTRLLADQVSPRAMQVTTGLLGTAVLAPLAVLAWQWPSGALEWTLLIAIGAFAWAGHEVLTRAHAHADASLLAPFAYSFIIYLTVLGWIIFGDVPTLSTVIGSLIIFVSAFILTRDRKREDKETESTSAPLS